MCKNADSVTNNDTELRTLTQVAFVINFLAKCNRDRSLGPWSSGPGSSVYSHPQVRDKTVLAKSSKVKNTHCRSWLENKID